MKRLVLSIALLAIVAFLPIPAQAATTIEWWQFWTDPTVKPTIDSMVADFERLNPDIKVKITDLTWANGHEKIVIAFASGRAPDIVELGSDWIAQFAASGQIADLSDDVAADSSQYQGWGMATYEGRVYAFPWILGTRVVFVNRDLLTMAGYDPSWVPVTLPHFYEAIAKIDSVGRPNGIHGWGSNTAEKHRLYKKYLPFFWSYGAQLFTDDGEYCVITSTWAVDALKDYKWISDSYGYVANQRRIEDAFLDGKIGVILSGDWLLKRIEQEKRRINFVTTLFPGPGYPGRSFMGGEFLAINEASDNRDEALKFVKFITSPENQVRFCIANRSSNPSSLVAQQDSFFTEDVNRLTFVKQIRLSKHAPVDPDWVYIEDEIERAVEDALFGRGLPATALHEAQKRITRLKKE